MIHHLSTAGPPSIAPVGQSKLLERVKTFLPKLQAAENELQDRIKAGENLDIEDCQGRDRPSIFFSKVEMME